MQIGVTEPGRMAAWLAHAVLTNAECIGLRTRAWRRYERRGNHRGIGVGGEMPRRNRSGRRSQRQHSTCVPRYGLPLA